MGTVVFLLCSGGAGGRVGCWLFRNLCAALPLAASVASTTSCSLTEVSATRRCTAHTTRAHSPTMVAGGGGWGVLVAVGDKSRQAKHLDRSTGTAEDAAALASGDIQLTLVKTMLGRMLMNAEGTRVAAKQVADILIDFPTGESSGVEAEEARPRTSLRKNICSLPAPSPHPPLATFLSPLPTARVVHPSRPPHVC